MVGGPESNEKEKLIIQIVDTTTFKGTSITGMLSQPLLESGKARALILSLDTGQSVAPCKMPFLVFYYFIEGQGQIQVESEQAAFHPGSLAAVPAETTRWISADLPTRVLLVQIP